MCKLHLLISSGYKLHVPPTLCVFELIAERILCKPPWKQSIKLIKEQNNIYWYPQPTIQSSFYLFFFLSKVLLIVLYILTLIFFYFQGIQRLSQSREGHDSGIRRFRWILLPCACPGVPVYHSASVIQWPHPIIMKCDTPK